MKILDRVLVYANNTFIKQMKTGLDFGADMEKTVRVINTAVKAQTELEKVAIAKGRNNDSDMDKELENEENNFFEEVLRVKTKAKDNGTTTETA